MKYDICRHCGSEVFVIGSEMKSQTRVWLHRRPQNNAEKRCSDRGNAEPAMGCAVLVGEEEM